MIQDKQTPTLSVVIPVHDESEALERNLPAFLTQECSTPYEVIVVDDTSTDGTPDILKRMKEQYDHLYTTFMPQSVLNQHRKRLSLVIGIKAAHNSWVVLADIKRPPHSTGVYEHVIQVLAQSDGKVVMFYSDPKDDQALSYQTWDDLNDAAPLLRKAGRRIGYAFRGKWNKPHRGIYDFVAGPRQTVYDLLKYYDQDVKGHHLWGLRLHVMLKNLLNPSIPFE